MVTVIGLGFVGLTTALGLCEFGNEVYGIDVCSSRINTINNGQIPFQEPGLNAALRKHLGNNFTAGNDWKLAISKSQVVFYCVGTPYGENGEADLSQLYSAIDKTIDAIKDNQNRVLVIKSTVPPTTTADSVIPYIKKIYPEKLEYISVANNPEFLREGHCWEDFINADRIVVGSEDSYAKELINAVYKSSGIPMYNVNLNTAEFIKYLSNTSLACMISYANEMSLAADAIGDIDVTKAFRVLHTDKRWQDGTIRAYMYPGCGYGGYCLPKDTKAFDAMMSNMGFECNILKEVIALNDRMAAKTADRIASACATAVSTIGILGLAFNAGSDDIRDTSAAGIIACLNAQGFRNVLCYDPMVGSEFKKLYPDLICELSSSYELLIEQSDTIAIVTAWDMFKDISERTDKPVIDCRYML